jgi:hypothetical protein
MRSLVGRLRRSAQEGALAPAAAAFEFISKPARSAFGGPLNDQAFRRLIVEGVISACGVRAVIETGSHRGATTEFFAASGVESIWTIESMPRFYWYTVFRLRKYPFVHVIKGDSRTALGELARDPATTAKPTLFYLDAHGSADLPLAEEIRVIAKHWLSWVAMIDDFKVPDDSGYGFDSYGVEATLDADYCNRVGVPGLLLFYPALESRFESGRRRGCAVVSNVPTHVEQLESLPALLRPAHLR